MHRYIFITGMRRLVNKIFMIRILCVKNILDSGILFQLESSPVSGLLELFGALVGNVVESGLHFFSWRELQCSNNLYPVFGYWGLQLRMWQNLDQQFQLESAPVENVVESGLLISAGECSSIWILRGLQLRMWQNLDFLFQLASAPIFGLFGAPVENVVKSGLFISAGECSNIRTIWGSS